MAPRSCTTTAQVAAYGSARPPTLPPTTSAALTLRFTHNLGAGQPVAFEISGDAGGTWSPIVSLTTTTSTTVTYQWKVTSPPTAPARVRASWTANPAVFDDSDVSFTTIPRITVTAPNTPVAWEAGSTRTVTWTHNLPAGAAVDIAFSPDAGRAGRQWLPGRKCDGYFRTWTGPVSTSPTTQALVRVSQSSSPADADVSNVPLILAAPTITVTAPNTNVNWPIGSSRSITWTHNIGTGERVQIDLSRDGGATWTTLATELVNSGNAMGHSDGL